VGDIKLFRLNGDTVDELEGQSVAIEKSLQNLFERHLETFLGVRFLALEYSTGKVMQDVSILWSRRVLNGFINIPFI
jgi:hypothetical protein